MSWRPRWLNKCALSCPFREAGPFQSPHSLAPPDRPTVRKAVPKPVPDVIHRPGAHSTAANSYGRHGIGIGIALPSILVRRDGFHGFQGIALRVHAQDKSPALRSNRHPWSGQPHPCGAVLPQMNDDKKPPLSTRATSYKRTGWKGQPHRLHGTGQVRSRRLEPVGRR